MSFLNNRTRLLDHLDNGSLLFRGNLPILDGKFSLKEVLDSMEEQAKNTGLPFDRSKPFYVYTLLSEILDYSSYKVEDSFFENNPESGKLFHDDVDGISIRAIIHGKDALGHAMFNIVKDIRKNIENHNINLYFHCSAGLDRTGIISAGYGLLYQNFTAEQAKGQNIALGLPRAPNSYANIALDAMIDLLKPKRKSCFLKWF